MINLLLNPVNLTTFLIVIAIVAVLAIVFSVFIVLVSKLCAVPVDEKAEKISELLSGANCGGCGFAGCADFAKALSEGKANISSCSATSAENKLEIAKVLGQSFCATEETVAVVHCAGGDACTNKFNYVGNGDCIAQSSFMGGKKACKNGCIGGGTCLSVCPHGAIKIVNGVAQIDKVLCESCSLCIKKCPKNIIDFIPKSAKIYIACLSECKGKEVMEACKNGCIGCGVCAKVCKNGAITMVNNHPVIDYSKCNGCKTCLNKCPRKCIKEF